jgi:hypothetical protein
VRFGTVAFHHRCINCTRRAGTRETSGDSDVHPSLREDILLNTGNETKAEKMGQALLKEAHDSLTATVR